MICFKNRVNDFSAIYWLCPKSAGLGLGCFFVLSGTESQLCFPVHVDCIAVSLFVDVLVEFYNFTNPITILQIKVKSKQIPNNNLNMERRANCTSQPVSPCWPVKVNNFLSDMEKYSACIIWVRCFFLPGYKCKYLNRFSEKNFV